MHRNLVWIRNQLDVTYVLSFISPLQVAQHVSDNHVPVFRSWRLRSVIATCWWCAVAAGRLLEPVSRECVHWGVRSYKLLNDHSMVSYPHWMHFVWVLLSYMSLSTIYKYWMLSAVLLWQISSPATMHTLYIYYFWNKLYSNKFSLFSHSLAKQIVKDQ